MPENNPIADKLFNILATHRIDYDPGDTALLLDKLQQVRPDHAHLLLDSLHTLKVLNLTTLQGLMVKLKLINPNAAMHLEPPAPEEAYALALQMLDESQTVVVPDLIFDCMPVLRSYHDNGAAGDLYGKRKAFEAVYSRMLASGRQLNWKVSLGSDIGMRAQAIRQGIEQGLLSPDHASLASQAEQQLLGQQGTFSDFSRKALTHQPECNRETALAAIAEMRKTICPGTRAARAQAERERALNDFNQRQQQFERDYQQALRQQTHKEPPDGKTQ